MSINDFNLKDIDRLTFELNKKGLSNTSVIYVLATLRKAFNFAVKRGYTNNNTLQSYDFPRKKKYRYTVLNAAQIASLLKEIGTDKDIYPAVLLASCYALRRGECLGLIASDISENYLSISRTSTSVNQKRIVTDCKTPESNRTILLTNKNTPEILKTTYNAEKCPLTAF